MNKITAALLSTCMLLAAGTSFAQDAMTKDGMKNDAMGKDAMKK